MSPPEVWGPPIWTLFHVLAEKINERAYPFYAGQLFSVIKNICSALPCPECTSDASIFLGKIKIQDLKTKNDFKNMVYLFHNYALSYLTYFVMTIFLRAIFDDVSTNT